MAKISKGVAGTMFVVMTTIVLGVGLYLPFYSAAAKRGEDARRQLHAKELPERAPGGVWKNINSAVKQRDEHASENAAPPQQKS